MKQSDVSLLLAIIFLTLIGVQGVPIMKKGRCLCIETNQKNIHLKSLKNLQQFSPSPSCEKTEIIAIMKNGTQTCLNPGSKNVKKLLKDWEKQVSQKEEAKEMRKKTSKKQKIKKAKRSQGPHQKKTI